MSEPSALRIADQTKVARDIDDAQRALSAWYGTNDLAQSNEWLATGLEAVVRAMATVARRVDQLEDERVLELLRAAEQVVAHIGESDEQDGKLLLDLTVAVDQLRRRLTNT